MTNNKDRTFVVVGASLAGALAVQALREEGFDGRVILIGDEPHPPYERPPLSKGYLRGETPREKTYVHPRTFYADNEIELLTSTAVREADAPASEVVLYAGRRLRFDRLLLATGAAPAAWTCRAPGWTASTTCATSRTQMPSPNVSSRAVGSSSWGAAGSAQRSRPPPAKRAWRSRS